MRLDRAKLVWLIMLAAAALCALYFKIPGLLYVWACMQARESEWKEEGGRLPAYRVTIEALPIQGIARNASGLTFNSETGTLFAVINRPPQIAELTTDGRLLRLMPVPGTTDLEGIDHIQGGLYVIADEWSSRLHWVRIGPGTTSVSVQEGPRLTLAIEAPGNFGLEGVSWDDAGKRLFIVKEKMPLRLLVISGVQQSIDGGRFDLQIDEWKSSEAAAQFMADLSAVAYDKRTRNLLVLSDETAVILEYAPDASPAGMMLLWRGFHGLSKGVPQAEGMAIGEDGTIYLLSEPNLFYRFERVKPDNENNRSR